MTPLERSHQSVDAHWGHLQEALQKLSFAQAAHVVIKSSWTADTGTAVLTGRFAEVVNREFGGQVSAYPFLVAGDSHYWLSWRERWDYITGSRKPWRFRESGITIFESRIATQQRTQIFRIEWPGFTSWQSGTVGWQAQGAGHPHWQFDALADVEERIKRAKILYELEQTLLGKDEAEAFGQQTLLELAPASPAQTWTRMHFASLARWAELGWDGDTAQSQVHTQAPIDEKQIRRWLTAAILYICSELAR